MQQQPIVESDHPSSEPGFTPEEPRTGAQRVWKFSELTQLPDIAERFARVRKYFFLRESTYDMTSRCNVRCDGCYYYEGDKQHAKDNVDPAAWRELMRAEKQRGITFVVLAGAEPALVPALLQTCYEEIPLGAIASNGIKAIPRTVGYRIHISVWGNDATSQRVRKAPRMLERQIDNYRGDPRAVWVYTFTRENIEEAREVVDRLAGQGCQTTFNMFSGPVGYQGPLAHTADSLRRTRAVMLELLAKYSEHVLFSPYSAVAHTHGAGLDRLYSCPYPRANENRFGLGRSFRQYRSDLTWIREAACCVPDTDCKDCRHYAAASAVVTARMNRHAISPEHFRGWLDFVDTYLAVWVTGYDKGRNLQSTVVAPPGFDLFGNTASPSGTDR